MQRTRRRDDGFSCLNKKIKQCIGPLQFHTVDKYKRYIPYYIYILLLYDRRRVNTDIKTVALFSLVYSAINARIYASDDHHAK